MTRVVCVVFVLSRGFVCLGVVVYLGVCLWLPRLVPNQRQLFIVVSDWGPYLGSHIPWVFGGLLSMCSCLSALVIVAARSFCYVFFV